MQTIIKYILIAILVTSCATKRQNISEKEIKSVEELFVEENQYRTNCTTWETGRPFVYISDKASVLFYPTINTIDTLLKGKIFTFKSIIEESAFGASHLAHLLFNNGNTEYRFNTNKTYDYISQSSYRPWIPHLIDLTEVNYIDSLLRNKTLYIRTSQWVDPFTKQTIDGNKLIPIVVDSVKAGNSELPFLLYFHSSSKQGAIYMLFEPQTHGKSLSFDALFYMTDPRVRYKNISDEHWTLITQSRIIKGMTKEACQLALGRPNDVKHTPTYSGLKEEWYYNTGNYLLFIDGLLQ